MSWDLTAEDIGPAKRTPAFHADPDLPQTFHHVKSVDYKNSMFDRGHMCPSADRTDNQEDNAEVLAMSNIIPQSKDNNEGVWEHLEAYCRELAAQGNDLPIICGPAKFTGQHLNGPDQVEVPADSWKVVVEVPNGPGSALSRISAATRVIAVDIPNIECVRNDPWQRYLVSVNQLEAETGFTPAAAPKMEKRIHESNNGEAAGRGRPAPDRQTLAPAPACDGPDAQVGDGVCEPEAVL